LFGDDDYIWFLARRLESCLQLNLNPAVWEATAATG
jgi:hypothetical protein